MDKNQKKDYMSDPRLRANGWPSTVVLAWVGDLSRGGGRLRCSENSGAKPKLEESPTSLCDDDRVGVRGKRGIALDGESGWIPGEGGAMMPSAPRDDARRMLGTKPNIRRKSEERERCCPAGGKDWADGEQTVSEVGSVLSFALRLRKRKSGVSQTQSPKKVAMSPKVGAFTTGPPR